MPDFWVVKHTEQWQWVSTHTARSCSHFSCSTTMFMEPCTFHAFFGAFSCSAHKQGSFWGNMDICKYTLYLSYSCGQTLCLASSCPWIPVSAFTGTCSYEPPSMQVLALIGTITETRLCKQLPGITLVPLLSSSHSSAAIRYIHTCATIVFFCLRSVKSSLMFTSNHTGCHTLSCSCSWHHKNMGPFTCGLLQVPSA